VLERTRGDLTFASRQQILTQALAQHLPAGAAADLPGYMPAGDDGEGA
jgi:hypothetical protein